MSEIRVMICSRKTAVRLGEQGRLKQLAVISFCDPQGRRCVYPPVDYTGRCDRTVTVAIHDLDPEALSDFGLTVDGYFPQAGDVAAFIHEAVSDGVDILCQCEYGQSRSAGCAAAILQYFSREGISVFADYRYYPNQLVYHKIMDALEMYGEMHPRRDGGAAVVLGEIEG